MTTPDSLGGNAEDASLYSFYWWLTKPKLLTVHPLKCSHGSFAMCCWFTVRADDLPKATQCVCVWGGRNTPNSETCLCSDLEVESAIYLSRCCQEKKRTLSPRTEITGHCLTLSYAFKNARDKKIPQMNPLCRNYGS